MHRFVALGSIQLLVDAMQSKDHLPAATTSTGRALQRWTLPVGLSAVFVWLFGIANPVVEGWGYSLSSALVRFFEWLPDIEGERILFWFFFALVLWPLVRTRFAERPPGDDTPMKAVPELLGTPDFTFRCLLLFNAVFLVQTVLDLFYLWGGAALPEGMTYAEYAHRGAYPLVATALLAALFVMVCFRPGAAAQNDPRTRKLVAAWIAQNLLLMISTGWRLMLYIDVYGLTRLRIATILWIGLVAFGLVTMSWRIQFGRTNRWLMGVNLIAAVAVLSASSFTDFDSRIAWHNVRNCRDVRGSGPALDLYYMRRLGPESLPALLWYQSQLRYTTNKRFDEVTGRLARELVRDLDDWRGWTFVRHRVREQVQPEWLRARAGSSTIGCRSEQGYSDPHC